MSHSHWLTLALTYLAAAVIFVPLARRLGLGAIIGYLDRKSTRLNSSH